MDVTEGRVIYSLNDLQSRSPTVSERGPVTTR
jgi:hypothetical protein